MNDDQKRLVRWYQEQSNKPRSKKFQPNKKKAEYLMNAIGQRVSELLLMEGLK